MYKRYRRSLSRLPGIVKSVDKIVSRLRTESKLYRRVSAWDDFVCGILSGGFSAGRVCFARPAFKSLLSWIHSLGKQTLHAKCEAHVAGDSQFAAHERDLPVKLAGRHIDVILRAHRDRDARRSCRSFVDRAGFVVDDDVPLTAVVAREVELVGRIQTLRRVFVEATGHRREDFFGGRRCCISHGKSSPPDRSGVSRALSAI